MKLKSKKEKPSLKKTSQIKRSREDAEEDEDEEETSAKKSIMGDSSWMIKGREELRKEQRRSDAMAKSGRRPPELWFKDNESKVVRFRHDEPIGIYRYSLKVAGKYTPVTQPGIGQKDLMKKSGLNPQLRYYYEVIDVKGYTDKSGKRLKNIARFLPVSGRFEKMIERLRQKHGGLTQRPYEISRMGQGTDTTYMISGEDKEPMNEEQKKVPVLMKEFAKYYAPPTEDEQRILLAGVSSSDDDDD